MNSRLARTALLMAILAAAWLLWSGFFKPLLLGLGVLSCLLTVFLVRRMGYLDSENFYLRPGWKLFGYWVWLGKEIFLSSLEVARIVLHPRLPIDPQVIHLHAISRDAVDQATLANSITLTPGSLTLDVHKDVLTVHTLTSAGADALIAGEMNRRVAGLRGR